MEKQNANPTVYNVSDLSHSTFLKGKEHLVKTYKEKRELSVSSRQANNSLFILPFLNGV